MPKSAEDALANAGSAPNGVGLLIVDAINDLADPRAAGVLDEAHAVADRILLLRAEFDRRGGPVVYVNDNFGQWRSERSKIVDFCRRPDSPNREVVDRLAPRDGDYFVIKPQFSGFYATNLQVLLPKLGVDRIVLTGMAADICVLFTAGDAHMRDYKLWAPSDATAGLSPERKRWALEIMAEAMGAQTRATTELALEGWLKDLDAGAR